MYELGIPLSGKKTRHRKTTRGWFRWLGDRGGVFLCRPIYPRPDGPNAARTTQVRGSLRASLSLAHEAGLRY